MARMEKLAQKLESNTTRAERTKAVERELNLPKPGVASMGMDLLKSVFKKLKGEEEAPAVEQPAGSVIPPTPTTGQF
jgi:hypothetical protein